MKAVIFFTPRLHHAVFGPFVGKFRHKSGPRLSPWNVSQTFVLGIRQPASHNNTKPRICSDVAAFLQMLPPALGDVEMHLFLLKKKGKKKRCMLTVGVWSSKGNLIKRVKTVASFRLTNEMMQGVWKVALEALALELQRSMKSNVALTWLCFDCSLTAFLPCDASPFLQPYAVSVFCGKR